MPESSGPGFSSAGQVSPSPPQASPDATRRTSSVPVGTLLQVEVQLLSVLPPDHAGPGGAAGLTGKQGGGVGSQGQVGGAGGNGWRLWGESSHQQTGAGWGQDHPSTFNPSLQRRGEEAEKLSEGIFQQAPESGVFARP